MFKDILIALILSVLILTSYQINSKVNEMIAVNEWYEFHRD